MTKTHAVIVFLALGISLAWPQMYAQTETGQQGSTSPAQQPIQSSPSSKQPRKHSQHAARSSNKSQRGAQPAQPVDQHQGHPMEDMPGMKGMEGMQHETQTPTTTQQQQSKPPENPSHQMEDMPGMEGMEGMQHGAKMEPLPPPRVPKLGMAQAEAKGPVLHLEQLEQMALNGGNPTLSQAATEIRAATGRKLQSGLWPNPTAGYVGEEIRGGSSGGGEQGFFVQQDIILGGKLGLNRKIFAQEVRQAQAESEEERLRVTNAVKIQYYQALAAQEMVEMRKELSRIAADTAKFSGQLLNVGQQNETEVLQAEVEAEQADLAVVSAEHVRRRTMTELAAVVGNPKVVDATLGGNLEENLPELDEQQVLDALLRESPAVRIAQTGVTRAEAVLARARRETVPDLVIRGGLQQNRERLETTGRPVGLQGFAEVGVRLKLFDRNQGNIQAAQADLERTQAEVKRIDLVLRERAASFVENYRTAKIMVDRYRNRILPHAQQAYELIYNRYGLMQASYPQVLLSEHMLYKAETNYIENLQTLWTNSIALKGFLLTDGLEAPTRPTDIDRPVREVNVPAAMSTAER